MSRIAWMRQTAAIVLYVVAACGAFGLSGCVFSDKITEVYYEQIESYEVDYDAPKIYINSPKAQIVSDQIPSLAPIDEGAREELNGYPHYEGDLSDADVREPRAGHDDHTDDAETDSGSDLWDAGVGDQHDENVEDTPQTTPGSTGQGAMSSSSDAQGSAARANGADSGNESDVGEDNGSDPNNNGSGNADGGDDGQADDGGGKTDGSDNAGNNGDDPSNPSNAGRNPGATFSDTGSLDDLPDGVHSVAAVGNAAIVIAALGGADGDPNLVAADAVLLSGRAAAVLGERGIAQAESCWSGNGTGGGANVQRLLELAPDAVLVTEGESPLSESELETLRLAGSNIVYMPAMTSHERIVAHVQRAGSLLNKGGDPTAAAKAEEYRLYTNGLVSKNDSPAKTFCSLYIDRWVTGVSYADPFGRSVSVRAVAGAPVGAASFPITQYMATSGVQNSANAGRYASRKSTTANAVVWPLAGGTNDRDWTGISNVNAGLYTIDNGYTLSLTRYMNSENSGDYVDLGTPSFPAVVVKTSAIADALAANRNDGGLYSTSQPTTNIASDDYKIHVNPCGMFSNWAAGSMESPLEMEWVTSTFQGAGDADAAVAEFYEKFYGYAPTPAERAAIIRGDYAG